MSTDILAALVPKGCEPPKLEVGRGLAPPPVEVLVKSEAPVLSFEELKQRLTGLPAAQYPILLALLVKGAWGAQAFDEAGIGEFVSNIEAGLDSALIGGKPEELVIFGLKTAPRLVEEYHERACKGEILGLSEAKFYERAGELRRLAHALKEFQDVKSSSGS